jgi:hypothetical protein
LFVRWLTSLLLLAGGLTAAESVSNPRPAEEVLKRYLAATGSQRTALRDVSMEVDIEANIPALKKSGRLTALRHISKVGKVTYEVLSFMGDNMIKRDVIARYMTAEVKSSSNGEADAIAINAENYRFRYRGMYGDGDWRLHLFELKPRKKRAGLFEGWLWVEDRTGLPVRESGRFVRTPSVFLKRVEFVRDYEIRDGLALPASIESDIVTRVVGLAKINIRFHGISFNGARGEQRAQTAALFR